MIIAFPNIHTETFAIEVYSLATQYLNILSIFTMTVEVNLNMKPEEQ